MISLCLHWPGSLTAENADGFEGWRGPIAALVLSLGLVAWRHVERLGAAAARPLRNAASCAPSMDARAMRAAAIWWRHARTHLAATGGTP